MASSSVLFASIQTKQEATFNKIVWLSAYEEADSI
jgi:hypothetical protein